MLTTKCALYIRAGINVQMHSTKLLVEALPKLQNFVTDVVSVINQLN